MYYFSVRCFSFSTIILRFSHDLVCINSLFLLISKKHSIVLIYQSLFIQSPVDGHLGCFQFVTITIKAALNSPVCLHMGKKMLSFQ